MELINRLMILIINLEKTKKKIKVIYSGENILKTE